MDITGENRPQQKFLVVEPQGVQKSAPAPVAAPAAATARMTLSSETRTGTSRLESAARWCIIALAGLLPIFVIPGEAVSTVQSKMLLIVVLVGAALILWLGSILLRSEMRYPRAFLLIAALLLPLAYIASALAAGWSHAAFVGGGVEHDTIVSVSIWYALLLLSAILFSGKPEALRTLLRSFGLGTGALIVFEIARLFLPQGWLSLGGALPVAATTLVGGWHDLGVVLGASIIAMAALLNTESGGRGARIASIVGILGALLLLIVGNMPDVWFSLAGVSVLAAIVWFRSIRESQEASVRKALARTTSWWALAVVALLFGVFGTSVYGYLPEMMQVPTLEVRPSWQGTYAIGEQTLSSAQALFLGSGPNSFARDWGAYKPTSVNTTQFWSVDFDAGVGVIPTAFITVGALGVAAWLVLLAFILLTVVRILYDRRPIAGLRFLSVVCSSAALYFFALHVIHVPNLSITGLAFVFLGALVASRDDIQHRVLRIGVESYRSLVLLVGAAAIAILLLISCFFALRSLASDISINRAIVAYEHTEDIGAASAYVAQAVAIDPSNDRAQRAAVELGILQLVQIANAGDTSAEVREKLQHTITDTIQHGLTAVTINRRDYQNWLTLAQLYQQLAGAGVEGAYEQAQAAYKEAAANNPTNPLPLLRLAQLETAQDNQTGAIEYAGQAIALKPDFAGALFLRSQLYAAAGQYEQATTDAVALVQVVPQDPLAWFDLGAILYASSQYEQSALALQQAVTLAPDYANALFILAQALDKLGETEGAIRALEHVQELNPADTTLPPLLESLRAKVSSAQ